MRKTVATVLIRKLLVFYLILSLSLKRGGQMVTALDYGRGGLCSSCDGGNFLMCLVKTIYSHTPTVPVLGNYT